MLKSLALAGALLCALTVNASACVETGSVMHPSCMGQGNPFAGARSIEVTLHRVRRIAASVGEIVSHPAGCPRSAFCGCGAAVRLFGHSVRSLWLAANWFRFPRAAPAPGMAAVRRHHVMVLEADLGNGVWQVFDANSGHHLTRVHARSIAGYVIVNPRSG
jgi:hypothetical protein